MSDKNPVIGISWQPKLAATLSSTKTNNNGVVKETQNQRESCVLWRPNTELVDGLFVPPNDPRKLNKLLKKQVKDTAGTSWFDMPAPTITPELKKDLQLLKENGTRPEYQLASEGVDQARLAGQLFLKELNENNIPLENVRICYSPFSRTRHTAEVVASVLNILFDGPQCKVMEDLRERFFGPSFELLSHEKYSEIWDLDEKDPFMRPEGGESVNDVVSRLATAMATMESEFQGCSILVVSHGDPLQILQTLLDAAMQVTGSDCNDLSSRIQAVRVHTILSQHRKNALLTGELRPVVQ